MALFFILFIAIFLQAALPCFGAQSLKIRKSLSTKSFTLPLIITKDKIEGALDYPFLELIARLSHNGLFYETGTNIGSTAQKAGQKRYNGKALFKQVHTIELCHDLYTNAKMRLRAHPTITVHWGDSTKVLPLLLRTAKKSPKPVFWLDGHYSGHLAHPTSLVNYHVPLLQELRAIQKSGIKDSIILIDDIRLCDPQVQKTDNPVVNGYPSLAQILHHVSLINKQYQFAFTGDILIAYLPSLLIKLSPVLKACTYSRLYKEDPKRASSEHLLAHELIIAQAKNREKAAIEHFSATFGHDLHALTYGVSQHYNLWYALTLLNDKKYQAAYEKLRGVYNQEFRHWRVLFYLAQAAYSLHKNQEGLSYLTQALKQAPATLTLQKYLIHKNQPELVKALATLKPQTLKKNYNT